MTFRKHEFVGDGGVCTLCGHWDLNGIHDTAPDALVRPRCPECGDADPDACSRCIREALGCCCHALGEDCPTNSPEPHQHACRAVTHFGDRRHCPDDGCPGGCWIWEDRP